MAISKDYKFDEMRDEDFRAIYEKESLNANFDSDEKTPADKSIAIFNEAANRGWFEDEVIQKIIDDTHTRMKMFSELSDDTPLTEKFEKYWPNHTEE